MINTNKFNKAVSWAFSASLFLSVLILMNGCASDSKFIVQKENPAVRDAFSKLGKLEKFKPIAEDFDTIREEVKYHIYPYFEDFFSSKNKIKKISKKSLKKVFKQKLQLTGELKTAVEKAIDGAYNPKWYSPGPVPNSSIVHFIITAIATCHYLEQFLEKGLDNQKKKELRTFLGSAPCNISTTWSTGSGYVFMNGYKQKGTNEKQYKIALIEKGTSSKRFKAPDKLKKAEKIMEEALSNFSQATQLDQQKV